MAYSSESSAQEYATTISQLIISVNQTHSGRHQLLAVVERISVGIFRKGAFGLMDIPGWEMAVYGQAVFGSQASWIWISLTAE